MKQEFEKAAENILAGKDIKAIQAIADSDDAARLRRRLASGPEFSEALEKGDTEAVKRLLNSALSSTEGERLAKKLSELMK